MANTSLTYLITAILLLNVVASAVVIRNREATASQRVMQLVVVWLLPVVGAVMCLVFSRLRSDPVRDSSSFDPLRRPSDPQVPGGPDVEVAAGD